MNNITIHDLAKIAGVNPSTVSRALRGDPRVRQSTRDRMTELAAQYGYIPNLNARNLADGRTRMIALLMGSLEYDMEREAAVRLNELFSRAGYTLLILSYAPDQSRLFADRLEKLTQKICDAAIIFATSDNCLTPQIRQLFEHIPCPLVFLDRWFPEFPYPTVTTDNTIAMRGLCDRALEAGADGAILLFPDFNTVSRSRREHLINELTRRGIPFTEEDIPRFLKRGIRKPAVFSNNATVVSQILPDLPEGFITAAFDRLLPENREKLGPVFLCIQDFRKIAETAAELVIRQLSGTDEPARIITIPPAEFLRF